MVNSKAKGNQAENDVCKMFSKWWGTPKSFKRDIYGEKDITGPTEFWHAIEVKHRRNIDFYQIFKNLKNGSGLEQFWRQAKENAELQSKYQNRIIHPMLVFKQNKAPWLVALPNISNFFEFDVGMILSINKEDILITRLEDFFEMSVEKYKEVGLNVGEK